MASIITVSQLNRYISLKLGGDLKLKSITIRGELSDFKIHYKSGHAYFTLKDGEAQLKGVMFSRSVSRLGFMPESGMNVLCSGSIEVYEAGGVYQVIATELVPAGIGAKFLQLNAIKEKLTQMGLFAQERKKQLPVLPKRIAVVTSLSGAALQDVQNILRRRYPVGELEIFPAQVQGEQAHKTIVEALKKADGSGADVIILTRGGGSFEDLMPFNTEEVATAVANCRTPVISAVGHETDTTLADHAADVRAPTPSAAAEICAPEQDALINTLQMMRERLDRAYADSLALRAAELERLANRLDAVSPYDKIAEYGGQLDLLERRLGAAYESMLREKQGRLRELEASLAALSPYKVLERGYAIALKNGLPVTAAGDIGLNDEITLRFGGFSAKAVITAIDTESDERN